MPPSDRTEGEASPSPTGIDWRCWLALGWMVVFGTLYARMVLRTKAPGAWDAILGTLGIG
jgi:hypothetical protein